jgi:hypothetical protein
MQAQHQIEGGTYERNLAGYLGLRPAFEAATERVRAAKAGKKKARKVIKAKRKQKHR